MRLRGCDKKGAQAVDCRAFGHQNCDLYVDKLGAVGQDDATIRPSDDAIWWRPPFGGFCGPVVRLPNVNLTAMFSSKWCFLTVSRKWRTLGIAREPAGQRQPSLCMTFL